MFFDIKKKITLNYSKSALTGFFPMDSRTSSKLSRGIRAISVRATEGLLYMKIRMCIMKFCQTDKILKRIYMFDDAEFL